MTEFPPQGAGATHKAESVGVLSPSSMNPQDIGKNWVDLGDILGGPSPTGGAYLGNGIAIIAESSGNIYRSVDYGKTWINVGNLVAGSLTGVAYLGEGIAIVGDATGHVYRSIDFGLTWTDIGALLVGVVYNPSYFGNGIVIIGDNAGNIHRSTNYGLTFPTTIAVGTANISNIQYLDNGIAIAVEVGTGKIFRSTNYGVAWSLVTGLTLAVATSPIAYLGNGVVVIGNTIHIYRSIDFGVTWTDLGVKSTGGAFFMSVVYLGNGIVVAGDDAANGHIYKSIDFGFSWTDLGVIGVSSIEIMFYLADGVTIFSDDASHIFRNDVAYKIDESQVNFPRTWTDVTASRNLNTTYTNSNTNRTLQVKATVRCAITVAGGNAYAQAKSNDSDPPTTEASGIVGIQTGLLNENNSHQVVFDVMPGKKYRIDSSATNGTVTKGKWFEMYI